MPAAYPLTGHATPGVYATTWRIWCTITITAEASSACDPLVEPISVASRWYGSTRALRYSSIAESMLGRAALVDNAGHDLAAKQPQIVQLRSPGQPLPPRLGREVRHPLLDHVQVQPFADHEEGVRHLGDRAAALAGDRDDVRRVDQIRYRGAKPSRPSGTSHSSSAPASRRTPSAKAGGGILKVLEQLGEPGPVARDDGGEIKLRV